MITEATGARAAMKNLIEQKIKITF